MFYKVKTRKQTLFFSADDSNKVLSLQSWKEIRRCTCIFVLYSDAVFSQLIVNAKTWRKVIKPAKKLRVPSVQQKDWRLPTSASAHSRPGEAAAAKLNKLF